MRDKLKKKQADAARYVRNRDKILAQKKVWDEAHPGYYAQRYQAHRDEIRAQHTEWNRAHPTAVAEWREAHPERQAEMAREHAHRRRARLRGVEVEQFKDTEIFERDDYICQICFEPIDPFLCWPDTMSVSLDHIIPLAKQGSHTRDNVQSAHLRCNQCKGVK